MVTTVYMVLYIWARRQSGRRQEHIKPYLQNRNYYRARDKRTAAKQLMYTKARLPTQPIFDTYEPTINININPSRTAVPYWRQSTQISSSLFPKRDYGSERVKGDHSK